MNKVVKRKLIGSIICFIFGITIFIYPILNYQNINDELHSYMSGFAGGLIGVGMYTMIIVFRAIRNPIRGKELENEYKDERLKSISDISMSITLKISMLIEALISIVCALIGKMEFSKYFGFAICFQLIVYVISYYIVRKKN